MADFTPKKVSGEKSKAAGSNPAVAGESTQAPPRLYLDHHHLAKLGMTQMPPVGSKIHVSGVAHVGSASEDSDPGIKGGKRRNMTLHMHKMELGTGKQPGVSDEDQEEKRAKGAKAAMDKALTRGMGGGKGEGEGDPDETVPRGGGD